MWKIKGFYGLGKKRKQSVSENMMNTLEFFNKFFVHKFFSVSFFAYVMIHNDSHDVLK